MRCGHKYSECLNIFKKHYSKTQCHKSPQNSPPGFKHTHPMVLASVWIFLFKHMPHFLKCSQMKSQLEVCLINKQKQSHRHAEAETHSPWVRWGDWGPGNGHLCWSSAGHLTCPEEGNWPDVRGVVSQDDYLGIRYGALLCTIRSLYLGIKKNPGWLGLKARSPKRSVNSVPHSVARD